MRPGTCLISGGAGFIGSWLCESLLSKGFRVICVDNLITGSKSNISQFDQAKFTFLNLDVSEKIDINEKVDYVFHLASPASPVHYSIHKIETMLANSAGTLNMLKIAAADNARFLYASSSEVYGEPKEHPQTEEYWGNVNPNGPRSCYDEGKRFSEAMVKSFPGVDARIARIFNTYGPRMNVEDGRAVPNFINQAISDKPITVYGNGSQTRSFCYVTDTVNGLESLMFSDKASGHVINIGNPAEISINQLAKTIIRLSGSKSDIVFGQLPKDDPTRRKPDITKAARVLGWKPVVGFEEGLNETIKYFRSLDHFNV